MNQRLRHPTPSQEAAPTVSLRFLRPMRGVVEPQDKEGARNSTSSAYGIDSKSRHETRDIPSTDRVKLICSVHCCYLLAETTPKTANIDP